MPTPDFEPPVEPTPLTRYALQDINTPCQTDGFYVELVSRQDSAYQKEVPIKRGTPYAAIIGADQRIIDQYASNPLYFLRQTADVESMRVLVQGGYDQFVIWIWATQTLSEDSYNSRITYMDEDVAVPRFERVSTVKRNVWEANPSLAFKSSLTSLLSVAVTAAGTGYTRATGTIGTAKAEAVCFNGQIIEWIVTVGGSGISSGGALTITGDGTGATASARIQPAGAILLHQEKRELPDGDPRSYDYVQIVNIYETVPGSVLEDVTYDAKTDTFITRSKQKKLRTDITPGASIVSIGGHDYVQVVTKQDIDANTAYEIVTLQLAPAANSLDTAIKSSRWAPFQFPATLDVVLYSESSGILGYNPPFTRIVRHHTFTYYAVSNTEPDITSIMEDLTAVGGVPILGSIYGQARNGFVFATISEIIYDAVDINYLTPTLTISYPGSDPDLTTYLADWIPGNKPDRAVIGKVELMPDSSFMYEIAITFVHFLIPPQGTPVP